MGDRNEICCGRGFGRGFRTPAEAVLCREVEQEGTAAFPFAVYSNFQTISKKHF